MKETHKNKLKCRGWLTLSEYDHEAISTHVSALESDQIEKASTESVEVAGRVQDATFKLISIAISLGLALYSVSNTKPEARSFIGSGSLAIAVLALALTGGLLAMTVARTHATPFHVLSADADRKKALVEVTEKNQEIRYYLRVSSIALFVTAGMISATALDLLV